MHFLFKNILIFLFSIAFIHAQSQDVDSLDLEWIKQVTKEHSPNSWDILQQYDTLPYKISSYHNMAFLTSRKPTKTYEYIEGNTRLDILNSMETNVHEISHAYYFHGLFKYADENDIGLSYGNAALYFYLPPNETYHVSFSKDIIFPSKKLSTIIWKKHRTYRFSYITGNSLTQQYGIVGLLNEFCAYYMGSQFIFDMLEVYQQLEETDINGLFQWILNLQSTISAYYEFDFFIKEYLVFMKNNHYKNYQIVIKNKAFVSAYKSIQSKYGKLIDEYEKKIPEELNKYHNENNKDYGYIKGGSLFLGYKKYGALHGVPFFSKARQVLLPVLKSSKYAQIEFDMNKTITN